MSLERDAVEMVFTAVCLYILHILANGVLCFHCPQHWPTYTGIQKKKKKKV